MLGMSRRRGVFFYLQTRANPTLRPLDCRHLRILPVDQIEHLICRDDVFPFPIERNSNVAPDLADDLVELRPRHSMAHADVLEDDFDALCGDRNERLGRWKGLHDNDSSLSIVSSCRLHDVLTKSLRIFIREARNDRMGRRVDCEGKRTSYNIAVDDLARLTFWHGLPREDREACSRTECTSSIENDGIWPEQLQPC